ncbi:response regulator [Granulosicoccus sp. 3-233]|uniref:response regulator n=1 Tax=Granulosicoccus sp. 3-233 TaxID=3417969 RepID=UPI003D34C9AC
MRLLLVEDTADVAEAIALSFARAGDTLDCAFDLKQARSSLSLQQYDVLILDINLPDGSGKDLLRELRRERNTTPVLMLTARLGIEERVASLDGGADDYLTKPFDLRELQARVRALHRRSPTVRDTVVEFGSLVIDVAGKTLVCNGQELTLTRREFSLLEALLDRRGRVASKEHILNRMFSFDEADVGTNAIELYVSRLRRKLSGSGVSIRTLRGLGYQLVDEA